VIKKRAITSSIESKDAADEFDLGSVAKNVSAIRMHLKEMIRVASANKLCCSWPGQNSEDRLKKLNLKLQVAENSWNISPKDLHQPLEKLREGPAKAVLACLKTKKIRITYHGDDSDDSLTESDSESSAETDIEMDEIDGRSDGRACSASAADTDEPTRKRKRTCKEIGSKKRPTPKRVARKAAKKTGGSMTDLNIVDVEGTNAADISNQGGVNPSDTPNVSNTSNVSDLGPSNANSAQSDFSDADREHTPEPGDSGTEGAGQTAPRIPAIDPLLEALDDRTFVL